MPTQAAPCRVSINPPLPLISTLISLARSQYRTGKILGTGGYAVVKEAIDIKTRTYYACKVINKKRMEDQVPMVDPHFDLSVSAQTTDPDIRRLGTRFPFSRKCPGLIAISSQCMIVSRYIRCFSISPRNFQLFTRRQTANNVYLCFDLCTGGELLKRIVSKRGYPEECIPLALFDPCLTSPLSITGMLHVSSGPSSTPLYAFTSPVSSTETLSQKTCCSRTLARMRTL